MFSALFPIIALSLTTAYCKRNFSNQGRVLWYKHNLCFKNKELESILNVAQSTCAGIINRLAAKEFVECFTKPNDKRIKLVHLTEAGEKYVRDVEQEIEELNDILYSGVSPEELDTLFSLLQKLYDNIK